MPNGNGKRKNYNHGDMMKVEGLAKEWDEVEEIRQRIRGGGDILHAESGPAEDVRTASLNHHVLAPMLVRMRASLKMGHPPIDGLRTEVEHLYTLNKRLPLPPFGELQKLSWRLRFLVCWVKMKVRRAEPSMESRLDQLASPTWFAGSAAAFASEDHAVQELCLVLKPGLQAGGVVVHILLLPFVSVSVSAVHSIQGVVDEMRRKRKSREASSCW